MALDGESILRVAELLFRELALFAACGFALWALDNLTIDLIWIGSHGGRKRHTADAEGPHRIATGRHAIFIPAWDEAQVIGPMLENLGETFDGQNYRAYVGCYPNDPATIADIARIAETFPKIRIVICPGPGPTTKADCLNHIWHAMIADERRSQTRFKAIILHDAEDLVDPDELRLFDSLIERWAYAQIPVIPLPHPDSLWISGHYCDEFAEAHGKDLVVRTMVNRATPLAGVGCAIGRAALGELAAHRGGEPFDRASLTEDYELGLTLAALGHHGCFARYNSPADGHLIAVRAYFPASLSAALRQKTRWVSGISLFGWERLGWTGSIVESWMRLRDRITILAALILLAGYLAAAIGLFLAAISLTTGYVLTPLPDGLLILLAANFLLLVWRLAMRAWFTGRTYGWRAALVAMPRAVISNIIAIMVARRAIALYLADRRGRAPIWEKTRHIFPPRPSQ